MLGRKSKRGSGAGATERLPPARERRGLGHPRPGALAQAQVALGGELGVCVDDDPARDAKLAGEIARRRHARAGVQGALADRPPQLTLDLRTERRGGVAVTESRSSIG